MVRWVVGSIRHGAIYRSSHYTTTGLTKAVVCVILSGMMHIKEPLLLIGKSSHVAAAAFILLSEWSSTICSTPPSRK